MELRRCLSNSRVVCHHATKFQVERSEVDGWLHGEHGVVEGFCRRLGPNLFRRLDEVGEEESGQEGFQEEACEEEGGCEKEVGEESLEEEVSH